MTDKINDNNFNFIKEQIERKNNYNIPYYATVNSIKKVTTDFDHFPYTRHFRGVYHQSKPHVLEREAGYRARHDLCYTPIVGGAFVSAGEPNHQFQQPANTVIPKFADESIPNENQSNCNIGSKYL